MLRLILAGAHLAAAGCHRRHTHATLLLKEGMHVKIVSERLGHANIAITLDTYSHIRPSMQQQAAEGIDRALFGT